MFNPIVNEKRLDKFGNELNDGDAVLVQHFYGAQGYLVRGNRLYCPSHYVDYEHVENGKYLPKPIEEIESKYLQKIDKVVFETFPFCEEI